MGNPGAGGAPGAVYTKLPHNQLPCKGLFSLVQKAKKASAKKQIKLRKVAPAAGISEKNVIFLHYQKKLRIEAVSMHLKTI